MDPDWWQRGVVYHAYLRSFADSDGDGTGDLAGLIEHLDHLNDGTPNSLGVDAILLSPIHPSPGYDVGYDVSDYQDVDPMFGSLADFDRLLAAAHERGMAVIFDLVLNHTSHLHPWFVASRSSRDGPFANWYLWRDGVRGWFGRRGPPNNWSSFFGGSAWTWDAGRGQYYLHIFTPEQPDLNFRNPAVPAALLDIVRFWLDRGVDGFRLDVFNVFYKDAALRSNPHRWPGGIRAWDRQRHVHDKDQPELRDFLTDFRALLDATPGHMSVGELFTGEPEDAARYTTERHLIFDFTLCFTPWRPSALAATIDAREAAFGPDRWPTVVLSNHDQPRHASRLARKRDQDAVAKAAAVLLLTLRGTPFVYYGEEIGMGDVRVPRGEIVDPPARRYWPLPIWRNRDAARAPMPWSADPVTRSWMRIPADAATRNVAVQAADPDSVLSLYRRLLWLRRSVPALQSGDFGWEVRARAGVLGWWRTTGDERVLVVINTRPAARDVSLPAAPGWEVLLSTHAGAAPAPGPAPLSLRPHEALILRETPG